MKALMEGGGVRGETRNVLVKEQSKNAREKKGETKT